MILLSNTKLSLAACLIFTAVAGSLLVRQDETAEIDPHSIHSSGDMNHQQIEANLHRSYLTLAAQDPIAPPDLVSTNQQPLSAQLKSAWSLVFFGFTSCPDVCPRTLSILAKAAKDPSSGITDRSTQVLFASVDPAVDTIDRISAYLDGFHPAFIGYTGPNSEIALFADQLGSSFRETEGSIDHSTSIFVVDPKARIRGVLLSPIKSSQIVADFNAIRALSLPSKPIATQSAEVTFHDSHH